MKPALFIHRTFVSLFCTYVLGTFAAGLTAMMTWSIAPAAGSLVASLVLSAFLLPSLLLSAWGGELADRVDKHRLLHRLKALEWGLLLIAAIGLWFHHPFTLYFLLPLLGVQTTLLVPVIQASLAQLLSSAELVRGSAWLSLGTWLALLLGLAVGCGLWNGLNEPEAYRSGAVVLASVGLLSLLTSFGITAGQIGGQPPGRGDPRVSPALGGSRRLMRSAARAPQWWLALVGIGGFYFLAICYLAIPLSAIHFSPKQFFAAPGLLLSLLLLGAMSGALLCVRFSSGRLELGLVPLGALLSGFAGVWLAGLPLPPLVETPASVLIETARPLLTSFFLIGLGGGLYLMPLHTLILLTSHEQLRARTIAVNHIVSALAIGFAAGFVAYGLHRLELRYYLLGLSAIALALGLGFMLRWSRRVLRLGVFALIHLIYRLRFRGRHHVPARGAALVICNHVSFMDALVLGGASPRPLRFLMDRPIYESPWLNWLFRLAGAIPVDSERRDPGGLRRSLEKVSDALRQGEVVMLFPEGRLTRTGETQAFRRGLDMILARDPVPVVPVGTAGLWGSWTSYRHGPALAHFPRRFRARVGVYFGEPIDPRLARRQILEWRVRSLQEEAQQWVSSSASATLERS
ncbi:MFS transporter [Pistricoccus aurantiacus]|uniref:MFS transporter n=1 Tax=Pistricoccus aurantiacus TaxID=1883414 RepID=A0A5B8ST59_9GAMM|nr:MFS transporter [Pistricoccus aurantiacus]QEA37858.1 MFS transporter [Pistricoccus aurantiacus]